MDTQHTVDEPYLRLQLAGNVLSYMGSQVGGWGGGGEERERRGRDAEGRGEMR